VSPILLPVVSARDDGIHLLTVRNPLVKFTSVANAGVRKQPRTWRLIGLGLLLCVFFLPLHIHFYSASQLSKECSCAQGTRKQLALADNPPINFSPLPSIFVTVPSPSVWIDSYSRPQNVRAPPSTVSL
jgi:hypothetical protein